MYNESFYPTPPQVAKIMLARIPGKELAERTILEPSAGKGDLADAICEHISSAYSSYTRGKNFRNHVLCIESEPELQAALRGKGYCIIDRDFLSWPADEYVDCIIMNPPFANADAHLLKAWEVLPQGDILCLVNTQTIDNPSTAKRRELAALIESHGEVEHLGACFKDAFRKTDVQVSLIHLKKEAKANPLFFEGMEQENASETFDTESLEGQVANRNVVANLVIEYEKSREIFVKIARLTTELSYYSRHLDGSHEDSPEKALTGSLSSLFSGTPTADSLEHALSTFTRRLKRSAWNKVFQMSRFENLVSKGVRQNFDQFCKENETLAFSEQNILTLLESLYCSQGDIMRQCILEAFDYLTRYHKENRLAVEGWKTNDAWKVNRRAVSPYCVDASWSVPSIDYRRQESLNDLDRAMAFLEGLKLDQVETIAEAFAKAARERGHGVIGEKLESRYFEFRAYKKGTLHIHFKDKELWERFNMVAAQGKNWLPDDYKAREKQEKTDKKREGFADQYGLPVAI